MCDIECHPYYEVEPGTTAYIHMVHVDDVLRQSLYALEYVSGDCREVLVLWFRVVQSDGDAELR